MPTTMIRPFGRLQDGRAVEAITLANGRGHEATILTLGATLQALRVPDARGSRIDIVLGHDEPAAYLSHRHYFGCTVGRHANRIARGRFVLDDAPWQLECNDGLHHLHGGGDAAFHRQLWQVLEASSGLVLLGLRSEAGDGGYPGRVDVRARYSMTDAGELWIEYGAVTDAPTVVNLTNHSYFNLAGRGTAMDHRLILHASNFAAVDDTLIPTGELPPVDGTPFDFRTGARIGARIRDAHAQLRMARGYDHHFVVDGEAGMLRPAARLEDARSGLALDLSITAPGLQFYSGNFLDGSTHGKGGVACRQGDGLCLEPQGFPDAPNQPSFPSTVLRPGENYVNRMVLRAGTS